MADQRVEVVEYDPSWPELFAEQAVRLSEVLGPWLASSVEHVGSTAVPGLAAKPVVDMLAPVRSLERAAEAVAVLERDGWLFWADDPCRHYRLWFLRPLPEARTHHLHLIEHGHPDAVALVAFRDALRADAGLAREYGQLKAGLADRFRGNRNAYSNAKTEFVEEVLRRVGAVASSRVRLSE